MTSAVVLSLLWLFSSASPTSCSSVAPSHGHLGWSESATIISPDRAWQVEVRPALNSEENQTPVTLRGCRGLGTWPLFILQRDAELIWGPDSKRLLAISEPLSGTSKLLLFDTATISNDKKLPAPDGIDTAVRQALSKQLGDKRKVVFYLPDLVSWKRNELVLAVGGETLAGRVGPMTVYCYGFLIDTGNWQVREVLTAGELQAKYGGKCHESP